MLLAVDTSTAQLGLAFYDGAQLLAESLWVSRARHTVELAPALNELFERTGLPMDEIRALGVALGPGSFTSLRVGLAFVKGLALARNLPLIGIPTLDVVAASQPVGRLPLAALVPAGRSRLAVGWYKTIANGRQAKGSPSVMTAEALSESIQRPTLVCGELSAVERQVFSRNNHISLPPPAQCVRRPGLLAELAYARWQAGESDNAASLAPIYLHTGEPIPESTSGTFPESTSGTFPENASGTLRT
jgi:tRNA threonylcarbamoyladenosine biosynthesis protein TsaB